VKNKCYTTAAVGAPNQYVDCLSNTVCDDCSATLLNLAPSNTFVDVSQYND